jgi:hypothetical protein
MQIRDPGSGMEKIRMENIWIHDLRSWMEKIWIRDLGSGINIPDQQN